VNLPLVPPVELPQVLPGVESQGPHDLQREALPWPPADELWLAVQVVSHDDDISMFHFPGDSRGPSLHVWEVTAGPSDPPPGLNVGHAPQTALIGLM
jgi:hypothetical protein